MSQPSSGVAQQKQINVQPVCESFSRNFYENKKKREQKSANKYMDRHNQLKKKLDGQHQVEDELEEQP